MNARTLPLRAAACLVATLLATAGACDVAPEPLHYRTVEGPFAAYEILDSYASTAEAGPDAIVDAEAEIELMSSSGTIFDRSDEYSDTPSSYVAAVSSLFPSDPAIATKYAQSFDTTEAQERAILIGLLCRPSYEKLASPIVRASISAMLTAGATHSEIEAAFEEVSSGRIHVHLQPSGAKDGVVAVVPATPVPTGTAIDVWVYGSVNHVDQDTLTQSLSDEGGDGGGGGTPPSTTTDPSTSAGSTTVNSTTDSSTTASTTVNTTTESTTINTTTESTTINTTTVYTTTVGGGGGGGGIDWAELLWDMLQGAGAGGTVGGVVGSTWGPGGTATGAATGAAAGAAAGAAYYFGSGFVANPECDRRSPFILC